ncbi:DUF4132 domain-containing protein [Salinibacterium sp. CAN_S4]|uniref:DUF4132 domain-containing protein n=1 Tax=Salinibacterium sp. CAN_S4 TaxID=2787727 RepID=UPI002FF3F7CD
MIVDPRTLLAESFSELDPRVRKNVMDYVFIGTDARFPSRLREKHRLALSAIRPHTRSEFYRHLDAIDRADDQIIVRLGRLLVATQPSWYPWPRDVPASIWAVITDARDSAFGPAQSAPAFTSITIDRIRALFALEGVRSDAIPALVIELLVGTSRRSDGYSVRGLQTIPGIPEFVAAHPEALRSRLEGFSEEAFLEVVRLASIEPSIAAAQADVLAYCAIAFGAPLRAAALAVVGSLQVDTQVAVLEPLIATTTEPHRGRVIAAIERIPDRAAAIGVLERALSRGGPGSIAIDRSIQRLAIYELSETPTAPDLTPMVPWPDEPLDGASVDSIRSALVAFRETQKRVIANMTMATAESVTHFPGSYSSSAIRMYEGWIARIDATLAALPTIVEYLSGEAPHPGSDLLEPLRFQGVSERILGLRAVHRVRVSARPDREASSHRAWVERGTSDVRPAVDVLVRSGHTEKDAHSTVARLALTSIWAGPMLAPIQFVEYMAEYPHVFDVILGLDAGARPDPTIDHRGDVLAILEVSRVLAARYLPVVTELAIGDTKTHRAIAQRVLENHGLAERIAEESLRATSTAGRIAAAVWVEHLGGQWALEALSRQFDRERTPAVRATILAALERLGRDIHDYLRPAALEAEAIAGLAKATPKGLMWFPFDEVPDARYLDGATVPSSVMRWWVTLAFTLKDPAGAGLLPLYVRTLDSASAASLGRFVLAAWLARDSNHDDEKLMNRALSAITQLARVLSMMGLGDPEVHEHAEYLFDLFEEKRERLSASAPSAISDKGMLALACLVPGAELAAIAREFMRRQHLKRAQIEALLVLLSLSDEPAPVQLLVATGRRHRTASVQAAARALIEEVATRRGWSPDELADRMIPTAGLDRDRTMRLDYGSRTFVARLGTGLKLSLETAEGEALRALPSPRQDDLHAPAVKVQWAARRKELASVVATQQRRLYDAMCLRREWDGSQWSELLLEHPIVGILVTGLVWHIDGTTGRPDLSGVVRTSAGLAIDITQDARISVAHSTTLSPAEIAVWKEMPSEVQLGFDQFDAPALEIDGTESRRFDLEGSPSESFQLRSRAKAREWTRGETGDGASFDEYVKRFDKAGLEGVVAFSGSSLPETSIPIELGAFTVRRTSKGRGELVRFSEVPPALLSELVADYLAFGAD